MNHGRRLRVHRARGFWTFIAAWVAIAVYYLLKYVYVHWGGLDNGRARLASAGTGAGLVVVGLLVGGIVWRFAHRRRPSSRRPGEPG
jgi:uncharacterized membrane protein